MRTLFCCADLNSRTNAPVDLARDRDHGDRESHLY